MSLKGAEVPAIRIPAKINLHLQVLGRREDGFHELRTLLQSIDLFDDLSAVQAADGHLELVVAPVGAVPVGDENLVLRAARALWRAARCQPGARLELSKRIPVGGGLGGGSADAAAALILLDRLWSLKLTPVELFGIAAELGSDVPFFLQGGTALGVGRGEEIIPLPDLPPLAVLVAVPELSIPTAEVYGRLPRRLTWSRPDATVIAFTAGLVREISWQGLVNDLQPTVVEGWPEVARVLGELRYHRPQHAAVTGSGAAVFAVFPDLGAARDAAAAVSSCGRVHVGVTLPREQARPRVSELDRPTLEGGDE
jgi:4-diphosphocytidyl-2-C-methyl-D-erythritol kinase